MFEYGHNVLTKISSLKEVHKQFRNPFIFRKKDYINYVKNEMSEIKKLVNVFKALT